MNTGTVSPLGMSDHAGLLTDRSTLTMFEEPLAEITVDMTDTKYMPGWLVYNRSTKTFWSVLPYAGNQRFAQLMHPEMAMDILAELYSVEFH